MKLLRFRVTQFRSVEDSGWIEVDDVTALIGENESGKSNLLLPLWKLRPAEGGAIIPSADYPRKLYTSLRTEPESHVFIRAEFETDGALRAELGNRFGLPEKEFETVQVSRTFKGTYLVHFPMLEDLLEVKKRAVDGLVTCLIHKISECHHLKGEQALVKNLIHILEDLKATSAKANDIETLRSCLVRVQNIDLEAYPKTSQVRAIISESQGDVEGTIATVDSARPGSRPEDAKHVIEKIPRFVYYSNYGNLDSEIYLPHVIQNMKRENLGAKETAKARTLKVLFDFVNLQPQEILELGRDSFPQGQNPSEDQIELAAERKKQRSILLQSASALLSEKFQEWWQQGDYRFRFDADGDNFRIWVSDDRRPAEIELEGRSTGLQWFLSFYLVFLVESGDTHSGCILLLDEPGSSLHPIAQRDLSRFFESLSANNQLIYTTHSPFLINADRLDRVRKVFVSSEGVSCVTANLGHTAEEGSHRGAGYAVHAALGLTVSESLLVGCRPIIVEGPSDQHILTAMKSVLIRLGRIAPGRELVFPPAGGAKGVSAIAAILGGKDAELPLVFLDSDMPGDKYAKVLRGDLYSAEKEKVLQVGDFVSLADAELEDLIHVPWLLRECDRLFRSEKGDFEDVYTAGSAILPQVEAWASTSGVELAPGWKVELSLRLKDRILKIGDTDFPEETVALWTTVFRKFSGEKD